MTSYEMEELIPVVAMLSEKFTSRDSTSITYERAQQLMEAVLYCIHEFEISGKAILAQQRIAASEAYEYGYQLVGQKVKETLQVYNQLTQGFCSYGNRCLEDTVLKGIPAFFKWYDARYAPQNSIITMDYPILKDLSGCTGIDAVAEYVKAIAMEQKLFQCLDNGIVMQVLRAGESDYREMIENLCSIVLMQMAGSILLEKGELGEFSDSDYESLYEKLAGVGDMQALAEEIESGLECMVVRLCGRDKELLQYILPESENLAVRIQLAARYGNLKSSFASL